MSRRQRGVTLIELMVSMAVVLVGMLGLFKVLGTSVRAGQTAQKFIQAQARAQQVMEAMRTAPKPVLDCLAGAPATAWAPCELSCKTALGAQASPTACIFSSVNGATGATNDSTLQQYAVIVDGNDDTRSSWVRPAGVSGRVYDTQLTIGWNDDGTATLPVQHRLTLRSAVFQ